MSGSRNGEARHSTLGQHAARTRRNASIALAKGGHTCTRWPNTHAANREREDPNSGTRPPPREDATRHDAATAAQDSAPKTAPARQKRGATDHRSRAQRAAQTTPPTGKSSPRRATRTMATHAHRAPKAATSTNWRQPAYEAPEGPKSLEKASDQSNTGGSWQQTAGGRGFAGAQNPGKSR